MVEKVTYGLEYTLDIGQPKVEKINEKFDSEIERDDRILELKKSANGDPLKITDLYLTQGNHGFTHPGFIPYVKD